MSIVNNTTYVMSPWFVNPKMAKLNTNTEIDWKTITMNCVTTCDKSISMPVIPETRHLSIIPSFFSMIMAPEVKATDKKNMILKKEKKFWFVGENSLDRFLLSLRQNDTWRRKIREIWLPISVHWLIKAQWNTTYSGIQLTIWE